MSKHYFGAWFAKLNPGDFLALGWRDELRSAFSFSILSISLRIKSLNGLMIGQ